MEICRPVIHAVQNILLSAYLNLYQRLYCPRSVVSDEPAKLAPDANVLVLCMNDIGDFVIACRFVRRLRSFLPNGRITLVTKPVVSRLSQMLPEADECFSIESVPISRRFFNLDIFQRSQKLGRILRKRTFDNAYVLRCDLGGLLPCLIAVHARAKNRVGFSYSSCSCHSPTEKVREVSLTHCIESKTAERESLRFERLLPGPVADTVDPSGIFTISDELRSDVDQLLPSDIGHRHLIGIALGANCEKRKWPATSFANAINQLELDNCVVVLIGSPTDQSTADQFKSEYKGDVIDLVGKTKLDATIAVLARLDVLVANDSGPAHLAEAAATDVLVVSCHPADGDDLHSNSPERFGPVRPGSKLVRPQHPTEPCVNACTASSSHCILSVSEQEVCDTLSQILRQTDCLSS